MRCPNCRTESPDGTSFCPKCDAVLDESLLEMSREAPGDDGDVTPAPGALALADAPRRKRPSGGSRPEHAARPRHRPRPGDESEARPRKRRPAPVGGGDEDAAPAQAAAPPDGSGKYVGKYDQYWVDDEPPLKKAEMPVIQTADGKAVRYGEGVQVTEYDTGNLNDLPLDPLAMVRNVWKTFLELSLFQRVYAGASVGLFCFGMIPWCTFMGPSGYPESDYVSANFLAMLLAAFPIFALVLLKSDLLPQLPRKFLPLIPVGAAAAGALLLIATMIYLPASALVFSSSLLL